ncbi:Non-hemolytic phospholipase C [Pseudocercospora fuligena]|uniref:Non-hemolytic phospholipase C n=1 Tax=Pseudocercospora fuligena TaxID=685502 RepID=A0A8H6RUZ0_9PEZI|nr:Non-hemolytic phospholipase C [Pseudocercospora fuligena]
MEANVDHKVDPVSRGDNGWDANHAALNGDKNNNWPPGNTPWSWAHFERKDIPNHFAIAEGYTVGDMYQESVIASTNPNRVSWVGGTINAPGSPPSPDAGGMYIDNNETPRCEKARLNCYPLKWKTTPEYLQAAGVSWQLYQDTNNFDDNPLAWFEQFQKAANGSELQKRGMAYTGLVQFYNDAASGNLPAVSYIVGPTELSEHQPYTPRDGGWLQQKIVDVVTASPKYNSTALIISYDETGGWGDHVTPYHSPQGTAGEWVQDPFGFAGHTYTGPGFRLPFYIISPWTRGGNVYTEHCDHSSQILFLEKWLAAKGKPFTQHEMNAWRRANMADLTKAFDFEHPNYSIPKMPNASYPSTDKKGKWNGYSVCESQHKTTRPPVPYGIQNETTALATEQGFKAMRGDPTEGRYLVFEANGQALTNSKGLLVGSQSKPKHDAKEQRFILHQQGETKFTITSAADGKAFKGLDGIYTIVDLGRGEGYTIQDTASQKYIALDSQGKVTMSKAPTGFAAFSVTYDQ